MKFDWYSATFTQSVQEVTGILERGYDLCDIVKTRGLHGYTEGFELRRGEEVPARGLYGGNGDTVHVEASGEYAPEFVELVRRDLPDHRVTRADVCEDFDNPQAWPVLLDLLREVKGAHRLASELVGDWEDGEKGRTYYLGGRASVNRLRLYEKGRQLGASPDWVRLELVVRPKTMGAKYQAARLGPEEFWGGSPWTREVAEGLGVGELPSFKSGSVWRPTDVDRSRRALIRQYRRVLEDLAIELGGWEAIGGWVRDAIEEQDRESAWLSARPESRQRAMN